MKRFANKGWKIAALTTAIVLIPTAAFAAIGTFTNNTAAPAVTGTNSSAAANSPGVSGVNSGGGLNVRYGVVGSANGPAGVGVKGTGTKFGVQSVGPFNATGAATFGNSLAVTGAATLHNTTITGTLTQTGAETHNGAVTVNGTTALNDNVTVAGGKTINCTGCVTPGDLSVPVAGINITQIGGAAPNITLGGAVQWISPHSSVTIAAGQKLVVSVSLHTGSSAGATTNPGVCWDDGSGIVRSGQFLDLVQLPAGDKRVIAISDTVTLAANTYTVGLCGNGIGQTDLADWASGYAMVIG